MGVFDYLVTPNTRLDEHSTYSQVKCWNRLLETFTLLDEVPPIDGFENYDIRLQDADYIVHIRDCVIVEFTVFDDVPVFDKWGNRDN